MGPKQKLIIHYLKKRSSPVSIDKMYRDLKNDLEYSGKRILYPVLNRMFDKGLIEYVENDSEDSGDGREKWVQLSDDGIKVLKYGVSRDRCIEDTHHWSRTFLKDSFQFETETRGVDIFRDARRLWKALRLYPLTLGHGYRERWRGGKLIGKSPYLYLPFYSLLYYPYITRNPCKLDRIPKAAFDDAYQKAMEGFLLEHRWKASLYFTPAVTTVKEENPFRDPEKPLDGQEEYHTKLKFCHSRCIWITFDLPVDSSRHPLPDDERMAEIYSRLDPIIHHPVHPNYPSAVIDGGFDCDVLFFTQNRIKNWKRLDWLLKRMFKEFNGSRRGIWPTTGIRIPGIPAYKHYSDKKRQKGMRPVGSKCNLIYYDPSAKSTLKNMEGMCRYWWDTREDKARFVSRGTHVY